VSWRATLHWRKARVVRAAAARLPGYDFAWAVITRHHVEPDVKGWNYHLVRREWGIQHAHSLQQQVGGWILSISEAAPHAAVEPAAQPEPPAWTLRPDGQRRDWFE